VVFLTHTIHRLDSISPILLPERCDLVHELLLPPPANSPELLTKNAAKANSSAEMVTAPKVKIVACKSGDAVDGKKGKGD